MGSATEILTTLPHALRTRAWLVYQGNPPESRNFIPRPLYQALGVSQYRRRAAIEDEQTEDKVDRASRKLESKFDSAELREVRALEDHFIANARKAGNLRAASPEGVS